MNILKENPGIADCTDEITYNQWEWVPNERTGSQRLGLVTHPESKMKLINQYLEDLHGISFHIFV